MAIFKVKRKTGSPSATLSHAELAMAADNLYYGSTTNIPIQVAKQTDVNNKVDKISGKGLSTEDYTTIEKTKLAAINQGLATSSTVQFAKVGIGTSSPNESLDVVGNARIRSEGSMKVWWCWS